MLAVTAVWIAITIWGGFVLVSRVYKHMAVLRETEDKLYNDYQTVLEGRKELTLNRERAEHIFHNLYIPDAREYRHHIIRADTFHLSAVNWSNIMMLGAIGWYSGWRTARLGGHQRGGDLLADPAVPAYAAALGRRRIAHLAKRAGGV